ncbi:MAG: hypothetical protein EOP52_07665 [Sphingobacteriales bacterium]|nr:MAG: hypothetical protein EOP52_07665 [Sphingobacteriales bacterium]
MKKITLLSLCALLAVGAGAQTSKKGKATKDAAAPATEQAAPHKDVKMTSWPELKAFHEIMSQTFHPAEEGNFEPIRNRSGEMVTRVKTLIAQPFPEPYRTADMKVVVANLEQQVVKVDQMVKEKISDQELMAALNQAHDNFHKIVGLCRKDGEAH